MSPLRRAALVLVSLLGGAAPLTVASCDGSSSPHVLDGLGSGHDAQAPGDAQLRGETTASEAAPPREAAAEDGARGSDAGAGPECSTGLVSCNGVACVDLTSNPNNCGTCNHVCTGVAVVVGCCASACVNNSADPGNCGACGVVCEAGTTCASGACK